jgi:peptide/nickel transport system permease protein
MPPLLKYLIRRALVMPISAFIISLALYGGVMLTPAEVRADLYMPSNLNQNLTEEDIARLKEKIITRYHLRDPFPMQYAYWVQSIVLGEWGYSPSLKADVLPALLQRTPATVELAFYSLLLFVPLGLLGGGLAGWRKNSPEDSSLRLLAFISTSLPPFILALMMLSFFYIGLGWFAPGRLSNALGYQLTPENFRAYTGMYTLDGLLNGRPDVTLDAFRHLAMPVFTLSLYHWATLTRITRASMVAQRGQEYIIAARARGIHGARLVWKHAFRNTLAPSLTSLTLSAASLLTGVFVVEIIYVYNGVSFVILRAMQGIPDAPAVLGFSVYSVMLVLGLMFGLDVLQALADPRIREENLA